MTQQQMQALERLNTASTNLVELNKQRIEVAKEYALAKQEVRRLCPNLITAFDVDDDDDD